MVLFTDSLDTLTPDQMQGFFMGWPNPPSPATHLELLTLRHTASSGTALPPEF